ncbi:MAG: lysine--tRNA ligase [Candidatus Dasytiphilus stammeri]
MCKHHQIINGRIPLNNELKTRRDKLNLLRSQGRAFPNDFRRNYISNQLHIEFDNKENTELTMLNMIIRVAGRMVARRIIGKASFVSLQDMGGKIQLYITHDIMPKGLYYNQFKKWDLGDIIGAVGKLFKTSTNELTLHCTEIRLLTKALRPLPNKFHHLVDQEIRYRQRYLDLITNQRSRDTFMVRSKIISTIRNFMIQKDFIEVETPMMQLVPSGAMARPFITHHNNLNIDMYLRIAPELYLKRLVIGGFERVFEINRNFRNEGISPQHNPEFTMMELYLAYADYNDLMSLIEQMFHQLTQDLFGSTKIKYGQYIFDFSKKFKKMSMIEAIYQYCGANIDIKDFNDINKTIAVAHSLGIQIPKNFSHGQVLAEIFENSVSKYLIYPTFITHFPTDVSPLARRNDYYPFLTDRFELFISGYEIGNGFSELNDAKEQCERFLQQQNLATTTSENFIDYDEDYITALEYGLPPTAGLGLGIDRLVMLLTNNHNIREVILFPTLRPSKK